MGSFFHSIRYNFTGFVRPVYKQSLFRVVSFNFSYHLFQFWDFGCTKFTAYFQVCLQGFFQNYLLGLLPGFLLGFTHIFLLGLVKNFALWFIQGFLQNSSTNSSAELFLAPEKKFAPEVPTRIPSLSKFVLWSLQIFHPDDFRNLQRISERVF